MTNKAGRPTDYCIKIADEICERLTEGESLRDMCRRKTMPNKATVFRWLGKHQEFSDQYARAREEQAEAFADEICSIADNPSGDVQRDRLRIDTRKWVAAKLKPKKYGDKIGIDGTINHKHMVRIIDLSGKQLVIEGEFVNDRIQDKTIG